MKVLTLLATGFEELEAIGTITLLRRAGLGVDLCSVTNEDQVAGKYHTVVNVDIKIEDVEVDRYDLLFIPGGMPGVDNLYATPEVLEVVEKFHQQDKDFAAICAGPSVLGRLGLLKGREYTCFPGFEAFGKDGEYKGTSVVETEKLITGRAAGSVHDFAFAIIKRYLGEEKMEAVKTSICYDL